MHVLGVMGSPRKGGNSDLLLDAALNAAVGQGARADKVYLYDLNIRPCCACEGCRAGDGCVQDDDMQLLYPKIWDADGLIIATPVYWWGPSAQTKAFLDRWYALVPGDIMRCKRVTVLCAHEDDDPRTARHLLGMLDESFRYLNMHVVGTLAAVAGKRGEVVRNQQAMARAADLGRLVACG
ncbi:MAG: flavodoxin family protein [Bacillota bacterium]|nr:flavodoxin family protein [Bacillota bacterium]MDI7249521.1 flavodoxin family protein [Bacillota bacterium]